jgi:predicted transcriptional regulator
MASTTVRLSEETRRTLAELAGRERVTISAKLTTLVRKAADDAMLTGHEEAMERLRADPRRLAEWRDEVAELEGTLGDGLGER